MERMGLPVLGTIHHPITMDRRLEMEHAETPYQRLVEVALVRLHQDADPRGQATAPGDHRVALVLRRHLPRPHGLAREALHRAGGRRPGAVHARSRASSATPNQIISTASSDVAMKGQRYLLEALAKLRTDRPELKLMMVGRLKEGSAAQRTIEQLGLQDAVEFVSGITDERLVELYNESACAVVPSLYEGFSLPAIEAMSTGCPLVATTGGAIPEVAGPDGETCYMSTPATASRSPPASVVRSTTPTAPGASARPDVSGSSTAGAGDTPPSAPSSTTGRCSRSRAHDAGRDERTSRRVDTEPRTRRADGRLRRTRTPRGRPRPRHGGRRGPPLLRVLPTGRRRSSPSTTTSTSCRRSRRCSGR